MNRETIKAMILENQYLTRKADKKTVVSDLCGLQAQFLSNAFHALLIRCEEQLSEEKWDDGILKTWTVIRGTIHVISEDDLGLFLPDQKTNIWQTDRWIEEERKKYFADLIVQFIESGITEREALKEKCFAAGMTPTEADYVFHPWGGVIRELAERGRICYIVQEKKAFRLCPPFQPVDFDAALSEIVRRYFTHYGPATLKDASYFLGIPQRIIKEKIAHLPLSALEAENKTYYYIPKQTSYTQDIPRCIFLAGFDPLMLGYEKQSSLFLPPEYLRGIFNLAGIVMPALLYNGRVVGKWKKTKNKLLVTPFETLSGSARKDISDAAEQLWGSVQVVYS